MSDQLSGGDTTGGGQTPSASSSPPASAPAASSSASTSTEPAASAESPGPIPYERFNEVNTKYGSVRWAEGLDQHRIQQQSQFFQWLDADPEGAYRYMGDYLTRAGALRAAQEQAQDTRPAPDVVIPETGQKFYSAEAAERLAEWQARQAVSPLEDRLGRLEGEQGQARVHAAAQAQLAEASTWPYFADHQADILAAMERDHRLSVEGAYNRVVVPKLRQLERQAVLTELNQKSQASTVNPGSRTAANTIPASKQSWSELFRRELAKKGSL